MDLPLGATAWSAHSDIRLKKNIKPLNYGLNEITNLRPVRFDYIEDISNNDSHRMGFIAQEVIPLIPEAITGSDETKYSLAITELMPAMVNAIKELNDRVKALETN